MGCPVLPCRQQNTVHRWDLTPRVVGRAAGRASAQHSSSAAAGSRPSSLTHPAASMLTPNLGYVKAHRVM